MDNNVPREQATEYIVEEISKFFLIKEVVSLSSEYIKMKVIPRELGLTIDYLKYLYKKFININYHIFLKEQDHELILEIHKIRRIGVSNKIFLLMLIMTLVSVYITSLIWISSWMYPGKNNFMNIEVISRSFILTMMILAPLAVHELGHFIASKRLGVPSTIPIFIPGVPGITLGTFGAVIFMRALPPTLEELAIISLSGPLAGTVASIIMMMIGLPMSKIVSPASISTQEVTTLNIAPLIFLLGEHMFFKNIEGVVLLSPEAFAAYLMLLIHFMNLLPVGQLDGGQLLRGISSSRTHSVISLSVVIITLLLSVVFRQQILQMIALFVLIMYILTGGRTHLGASYDRYKNPLIMKILFLIWLLLLILLMPIPI